MSRILQRLIRMMKRSFGILHLISGINSPISCRRKIFVFLSILIRLEHRCCTALYILVKELISLLIFLLPDKPGSSVIEVRPDSVQIFRVRLTEIKLTFSFLIRNHLYGIKSLGYNEELSGCIEELGCIIRLFEIEFFITLLILLLHSIEENAPNLPVFPIGRIRQEFAHTGFCLCQILASLYQIFGCNNLLLLCLHPRWCKQKEKCQ